MKLKNLIPAPLMSTLKYAFWTGVSALVYVGIDKVDEASLPIIVVPIVASILKGIATAVQNLIDANKPE